MSGKHETLALRLTKILIKLNEYGKVNINELAKEFAVTVRTLQKDLNNRLYFLDWQQAGPREYILNPNQLGLFTKQDIERFAHFASVQELFPKLDRTFFQKQLNDSIKVKGFQYESIKHLETEFKLIQQAIENHQIITFSYQKANETIYSNRTLEPYVLLNKNGIWYLIGLEDGKQKTFCFTQINFIQVTDKTFEPDVDFLNEIEKSDSISHGNQLNEVIIRVNAKVSHYFLRRNLLPNQEILHQLENGEILLSCKNIHELEIIPLVLYWMPNLTIVSPIGLQEKLINKMKEYITNTGEIT